MPYDTGGKYTMESYKSEFIEFMVESDVLKFGDFTLKSGRKSPFFMNAGAYVTGSQLKKLGEYYAKAIHASYGDDFDVLFGPAYKGIPLAVVTAIAFSELYGKEIRYCSDRKEAKDHGADKGGFLGSSLKDGDRVVMIEDVTTSGKSMEETVPKVRGAANVEIVGLMVSLNRMEVGQGGVKSALDEIHEKYGFEGKAIVTMVEVVEYLYNLECQGRIVIDDTIRKAIDAYYEQYGCKKAKRLKERETHMRNRRRRGYKFTEKKHSRQGILATVLALALLVWYLVFLKLAFQGGGSLSAYYGSAGVVAMIATFVVLVIAAKSLREEDSFQLFPRLGLGLTLLDMVCWIGTYIWGFLS